MSRRGAEWSPRFEVELEPDAEAAPRYNIAPTQSSWVIRASSGQYAREAALMRWGLVPFWAKDISIGNNLINARSETVLQKPAFRDSFVKRRCLIPADGFYEWKKLKKAKQPFDIGLKDGSVFAFAGLWDRWQAPDGNHIESFTILTTAPNELVKPVHDRMPVILQPKDYSSWLAVGNVKPNDLIHLLNPYPGEEMQARAVGKAVNSPHHDAPDCLDADAGLFGGLAARA